MKIRTGFVSNSSGSSFVLVYLPKDFDFDIAMESFLEKYKGNKKHNYMIKEIDGLTKHDVDNFIKHGIYHQGEDDNNFYSLSAFFNDYTVFVAYEACLEEGGIIKLIDDRILDKSVEIDNKHREDCIKYKDAVKDRKIKREIIKDKMKGIDPYGEEEWDDEDNIVESYRIRRFKK